MSTGFYRRPWWPGPRLRRRIRYAQPKTYRIAVETLAGDGTLADVGLRRNARLPVGELAGTGTFSDLSLVKGKIVVLDPIEGVGTFNPVSVVKVFRLSVGTIAGTGAMAAVGLNRWRVHAVGAIEGDARRGQVGLSVDRVIGYQVELEFAPGSVLDITDQVLAASWERALATYTRNLQMGTADLVVANDAGSLSPLNLPTGLFRPGVGVEIRARESLVSSYATLFTGVVDRISVSPALSSPRNIVLSCRDKMKDLANRRIDTSIMTEVNVGSLVATVLDAGAISPRSIDAIGDTIPFAWFRDRQVTSTIEEIIDAGGYSAYVAGDGTFRFRDRFFDLGGTVVGSYQEFGGLTWEVDDADVVNRVRVRGEPRTVVSSVQPVARLTEVLTIPGSSSVGFFIEYQDPRNQEAAPAIGVVTPVASEDWTLNAAADGGGADLTSQGTITFVAFAETAVATISNVGTTAAYLTAFQVRGQPIQREPYLSVQAELGSSQLVYGIREATLETRLFGTRSRLEQRAADLLDLFGEPNPRVGMTLTNRWPDVLTLDLADIIWVAEPITGVRAQFTIQSVRHEVNAQDHGWVHGVQYELEQSKAVSPLILDSATDGILNTNRLGRAPVLA